MSVSIGAYPSVHSTDIGAYQYTPPDYGPHNPPIPLLNFFSPVESTNATLGDTFVFGGAYYTGDFGYFLPIPVEGGATARRRYIFIN